MYVIIRVVEIFAWILNYDKYLYKRMKAICMKKRVFDSFKYKKSNINKGDGSFQIFHISVKIY